MSRRPPRSTRTDTLCPYPTLCRSVALGLRLGIVEQGQRRDAGAVADVEQRDLLLALCPVALFHLRRRRRFDLHLLAPGAQFGLDLARLGALLAVGARLLPLRGLLAAAAEQVRQIGRAHV